jgi:hypothetical protein
MKICFLSQGFGHRILDDVTGKSGREQSKEKRDMAERHTLEQSETDEQPGDDRKNKKSDGKIDAKQPEPSKSSTIWYLDEV